MFNQFRKSTSKYLLIILFFISLTFSLWVSEIQCTTLQITIGKLVTAQMLDAVQLVNKGIESYQKGDFCGAITLWEEALKLYKKSNNIYNIAIINENLARAYQQLGDSKQALSYWEKLVAYYRSQKDLQKVERLLIETAQAYTNLGQIEKAISILCGLSDTTNQDKNENLFVCQQGSALQIAREQKDAQGEVAALGSLGEAYRLQGNYDQAIKYLETAKNNQNKTYNFAVFNSLGNAHASRAQLWDWRAKSAQQQGITKASDFQKNAINDYEKAREYFKASIKEASLQNNPDGELRSNLNLIQLAYRAKGKNLLDENVVEAKLQQAIELIEKLPDTINKVYALIDLANLPAVGVESTSPLTQCSPQQRLPETQVKELFNKAIKIAQTLQDSRPESYALGALGHFYECQQESQLAWELTNKAIWLADQNLQAKDSLYLWEWQAGRILEKQGKINEALSFYNRAYNTLEKLRSEILITNRDFQFDFRDVVEPVYRQLAQLQLELHTSNNKDNIKRSQQLNSALITINSLRLAEIQNYFGNNCIIANINKNNIDELIGNDTAVISSIIFKGKTGILLRLPNQEEYLQWIDKSREGFRQEIADFRNGLIKGKVTVNYNTTTASNIYELIIRPIEQYLNPEKIKTLVFIQDGFLRDVPMAALYDNQEKKYLIQKYAIANTSSLQLTAAKKGNLQVNRALVLAVSKESKVDEQIFPELASVPLEIKGVKQIFPNSKDLPNEKFSTDNLKREFQNTTYPIIHIATHAQFGTIPEDTFLVIGNNGKLTINQLEELLRQAGNVSNSVELLALTACQTATGDERATLGLAGVALQAGTKSAIASLWSVGDESTAYLITEFYEKLRNSRMSKAQALQAAQLKLINAKQLPEINDRYDNPYYWAPFILIGNWL